MLQNPCLIRLLLFSKCTVYLKILGLQLDPNFTPRLITNNHLPIYKSFYLINDEIKKESFHDYLWNFCFYSGVYRKSSIRSRPLIQVYSIRGRAIGGSVQALIIGKSLNPSKLPYLDLYELLQIKILL